MTITEARPRSDVFMRRLLRIEDRAAHQATPDFHRAFSISMVVSGLRCTLTYVILPFLAPALGWLTGVGPLIGLPLGAAAVTSNVITIRRFWAADHRWRWAYTAVALCVMGLVMALMVEDVADLTG